VSIIVAELDDALRSAGVADEQARAAAAALIGAEVQQGLATKADVAELRRDMAELEARLIRWAVGTIIAMTAVFAAIVKLL